MAALGRLEEALEAYDQAISLDFWSDQAWIAKGNALDSLGRHEEALRAFDQAIVNNPRNYYPWLGKGQALNSSGHHVENHKNKTEPGKD